MKSSHFARALWLGILGALFFAFTFIFNRSMNLAGGSWMWSASLRYLFSLPMMAVLVWQKGELKGWSLLCALIDGFYLWRIMVCGCDLADYDFSWSPSDPTFWTKDSRKTVRNDFADFVRNRIDSNSIFWTRSRRRRGAS